MKVIPFIYCIIKRCKNTKKVPAKRCKKIQKVPIKRCKNIDKLKILYYYELKEVKMKRKIYSKLLEWKNMGMEKPLMVIGARQTGKTYIIEKS